MLIYAWYPPLFLLSSLLFSFSSFSLFPSLFFLSSILYSLLRSSSLPSPFLLLLCSSPSLPFLCFPAPLVLCNSLLPYILSPSLPRSSFPFPLRSPTFPISFPPPRSFPLFPLGEESSASPFINIITLLLSSFCNCFFVFILFGFFSEIFYLGENGLFQFFKLLISERNGWAGGGKKENIGHYLKAINGIGIRYPDLFETPDLYEKKNLNLVITHIHVVAHWIEKTVENYSGPKIQDSSQVKTLWAKAMYNIEDLQLELKPESLSPDQLDILAWYSLFFLLSPFLSLSSFSFASSSLPFAPPSLHSLLIFPAAPLPAHHSSLHFIPSFYLPLIKVEGILPIQYFPPSFLPSPISFPPLPLPLFLSSVFPSRDPFRSSISCPLPPSFNSPFYLFSFPS